MLSWEFWPKISKIYKKESGSANDDTNDVINSSCACGRKKPARKKISVLMHFVSYGTKWMWHSR